MLIGHQNERETPRLFKKQKSFFFNYFNVVSGVSQIILNNIPSQKLNLL